MHTLDGRLLALRSGSPALRSGSMELHPLDGSTIRFERVDDAGERVVVLVNFADHDVPWPDDLSGAQIMRA